LFAPGFSSTKRTFQIASGLLKDRTNFLAASKKLEPKENRTKAVGPKKLSTSTE
jgi:hypothetical protein